MGEVYEKTIDDDGEVQVPKEEAAKTACVVDPESKEVLGYVQVGKNGEIQLNPDTAGSEVEVVIPSDEEFENYD